MLKMVLSSYKYLIMSMIALYIVSSHVDETTLLVEKVQEVVSLGQF